ncbi:MAG TPA: M28 family peptidase, partial [Pyrinomonadaceae bacterium]|nr:M28 family peptidase [Pyrinomonadaceae bacterium]
MKKLFALLMCVVLCAQAVAAQGPAPLLPEASVARLSEELSGETAKRNLEFIAREHRMRGSRGFSAAAAFVAERLREYGLADVRVERFPADGKVFYGTQRARPAWDAEFAELWELAETKEGLAPAVRVASWETTPVSLAQDSESAEVASAELVDVGAGTTEADYAGRDVRGKLVLASSQPGAVARLAVERRGAVGVLSYAQNQRTAWWGENENLVRWGHLESFNAKPTFAFMLSLKQARAFQSRLARGERVLLRASVKAGRHAGFYEVVTATIPGADPRLREEEIAYSCHLDHQRPGANDNASGSAAILEVARTFSKLIRDGKLPRPRRTLRFIWPPEIEGTLALLNARPEVARRTKAVIHMDMVGGGPETKAVFHVTRGPASLPSFVNDVAEEFGRFVNEQSARFAKGQASSFPLHSPEGGKEALQAEFAEFTLGSDHQIYTDGSFGIPAVYLNDWPDRYIHTNFDTPANVDPTKLKRAAFIGAATGYFLAGVNERDAPALLGLFKTHSLRRAALMLSRRATRSREEADNLTRFFDWHEREVVRSFGRFFVTPEAVRVDAADFLAAQARLYELPAPAPSPTRSEPAGGSLVFRRNPDIKG